MKVSTVLVMSREELLCHWEACMMYPEREKSSGSLTRRPCSMRSFILVKPGQILCMQRYMHTAAFVKCRASNNGSVVYPSPPKKIWCSLFGLLVRSIPAFRAPAAHRSLDGGQFAIFVNACMEMSRYDQLNSRRHAHVRGISRCELTGVLRSCSVIVCLADVRQ
jgi:hypothetical protein